MFSSFSQTLDITSSTRLVQSRLGPLILYLLLHASAPNTLDSTHMHNLLAAFQIGLDSHSAGQSPHYQPTNGLWDLRRQQLS